MSREIPALKNKPASKGQTAWHRIGRGTKRLNTMARNIREYCKREGMPFEAGIDYAIRHGMTRQHAVFSARMAYRIDPPIDAFKPIIVEGKELSTAVLIYLYDLTQAAGITVAELIAELGAGGKNPRLANAFSDGRMDAEKLTRSELVDAVIPELKRRSKRASVDAKPVTKKKRGAHQN